MTSRLQSARGGRIAVAPFIRANFVKISFGSRDADAIMCKVEMRDHYRDDAGRVILKLSDYPRSVK